jgi:putative peptidoglycan lipid II flippase
MVKGFRQIAFFSTLSRILGLVRDIAYAHVWGRTGLTDRWIMAFMIPNLALRIFGEGALSTSFIPVYLEERHKNPDQATQLASTVTSVLVAILSGVVLAGELGIGIYLALGTTTPDTRMMLVLTAIMLPYMIMLGTTAVLGGILNAHRHFAAPAVAPILLNIVIIGTLAITSWGLGWTPEHQLLAVAVGVVVSGVLQWAVHWLPLQTCGVHLHSAWEIRSEPFRRIFLLMGPMVLGLTVTQINTLANNVMAWILSGSDTKGEFFTLWGYTLHYPLQEGAVAGLYYAQRLYQFPLGVLGISLATALYPVLSSDANRGGDLKALRQTVAQGIQSTLFVAVPATVGFVLISREMVSMLFEQGRFTRADTPVVALTLVFYALGLCGYFMQQILTRAFYAMQDSKMPLYSALAAVLANVILSLVLIGYLGISGLALATAVCAYLQVALLAKALHERLGGSLWEGVVPAFLKTLIATAMMAMAGLVVLTLMKGLSEDRWSNAMRVLAVVPGAGLTYLGVARLLRIEALSLIFGPRRPQEV